jgi:hypothetical protein
MSQKWTKQRPNDFTLNRQHALHKGLVFAGLGRSPGGLRCCDSSPYANHGTLTASWSFEKTLYRPTLVFTGSQYLATRTPVYNSPFTVSLWTYWPYSGAQQWPFTIQKSDSNGHLLQYNGNTPQFYTYDGDYATASYSNLSGSVWYHFCCVSESTAHRVIYRNAVVGTPETTNQSVGSGTYYTTFGARSTDGSTYSGYFTGKISDPMIWSRALSPSEIRLLADPSNVMLSGLIVPPRRRFWGIETGGATPTFKAAWARNRNILIGGGVS